MNKIGPIKDKNILLLQGPIGFFFKKLGEVFSTRDATVYRIGFNAGDKLFSSWERYVGYKGKQEDWYEYIYSFLKDKNIDKVFIFGDCRFYQSVAIGAAKQLGIEIFVFEEGYLRPHYVTLEKHGVNDYSHLPRDPAFYKNIVRKEIPSPLYSTPNAVCNWAIVTTYYVVARVFFIFYPYYKHHRNFSAILEFLYGLQNVKRQIWFKIKEYNLLSTFKNKLSKKYFFVPLQTHNDFQILQHSGYGSLSKFIIEVLESFAKNTKKEHLVFKHHPIDRGRRKYTGFIKEQAQMLGIENRIYILHDVHLPTLLEHAKGTITINSTVGLSSILKGIPTIALGKAIYDIDGLSNKNMSLDDFWTDFKKPNMELSQKFKQYLLETTQINGHFYGRFPMELLEDDMYT